MPASEPRVTSDRVQEEQAEGPPDLSILPPEQRRNLVARMKFPHQKVVCYWKAHLAYADKAWEQNDRDAAEAIATYERENSAEAGDPDTQDPGARKDTK